MDDFDTQMTQHQISWRKTGIESAEWGAYKNVLYPHILPEKLWEQGLWRGIRSNTDNSLPQYLRSNRIQKHTGVNNLKSSWIVAANLYFPFRATQEGRDLLSSFLAARLGRVVSSVDSLELEYAEGGELHPSVLLGEKGGSRGAGQTSPDIAFKVNGGAGLILVENKFVEHSFYRCSARISKEKTGRPANPDANRCLDVSGIFKSHETQCHQTIWGRKYWEHLAPVIDNDALSVLHSCPAATAGYQLFRQQALAEGIAASSKYDFVYSCVALDDRNEVLMKCLRATGIADVDQWGQLFKGKAHFALFTHQSWVAWVRQYGNRKNWGDWLQHVEARYQFTASADVPGKAESGHWED